MSLPGECVDHFAHLVHVITVTAGFVLFQLWDLTAGKLLTDLRLHTAGVNVVEFHPNELLLSSGSSDR